MGKRTEASIQRKATAAALHETQRSAKAERARERELAAEANRQAVQQAQADAQQRARALTTIVSADVPKTQGEVRALAKALTPRMMEILVEIAENPMQPPQGRVAAAQAIIDRAHGKPIQPTVELPSDVLTDMDDDELREYLLHETSKFIEGEVIKSNVLNDGNSRGEGTRTEAVGGSDDEAKHADRSAPSKRGNPPVRRGSRKNKSA